MKKIVLVALASLSVATGYAQNSAVQSARNYMKEGDFEKAKEFINQATEDPSTKDKAKTWFTKGDLYVMMSENPQYAQTTPPPHVEAYNAYKRMIEIDPDFERESMNTKFPSLAFQFYNQGVGLYKENKFAEAATAFEKTVKIRNMEGGRRFKGNPGFDTLAAFTKEMLAYSLIYENKNEDAIKLLLAMKDDPITKKPSTYLSLSEAYSKLDKKDEQIKILTEARALYPNDANLRNEEINYYIATNKVPELVGKLEAAVKQEPNNAEFHATLANLYMGLGMPKEGKPAVPEAKEYLAKAEASYKKAISLDPDNAEINYNTSVFYYSQAYDITMKMNDLKETAEDNKKYAVYKKEREAMFNTALPYAEKAYSVLAPKENKLSAKEKEIYASSVKELFEIYTNLDNKAKSEEYMAKKKALEGR